jgi:hypothetical protein
VFQWKGETAAPAGLDPVHVEPAIKTHLHDLFYILRDKTPAGFTWVSADLSHQYPSTQVWTPWKTIALGWTGNDSGGELPAGVSAVITGPTGASKRRARKFLPPLSETHSDSQSWVSGALVSLTAWAVKWLGGIDVADLLSWLWPIAYDFVHNQYSKVTSSRVNTIPGYQRRRKPGVGA